MTREASGAALIGRILADVAASPACSVSELAVRLGAARTTLFDAVSRLEAAGFLDRDALGIVSVGPHASRLGYGAFQLAEIAGAVEALLPALRDNADARVEFAIDGYGTLARRGLPSPTPAVGELIEARVAAAPDAVVRLHLKSGAQAAERAGARRSAKAVADAFSAKLPSSRSRDNDDRSLHDPRPRPRLGGERGELPSGQPSDAPQKPGPANARLRRGRRRDA